MDGGAGLYPRAHRLEVREPADVIALARGAWTGEAYRLGPGPFALQALRIALEPGLCIEAWRCEGAARARLRLAPDTLHIAFLRGDGLRMRGWRVTDEVLAVTTGGGAADAAVIGHAEAVGMCVKGPLFGVLGRWPRQPVSGTVLLPVEGGARRLRDRLQTLVGLQDGRPAMSADAAREALLRDAGAALAEALDLPDLRAAQPGRRRHALASAAEELLWSRVGAPETADTSLDALCGALGTTRRTLQLAFQEHFGTNYGLVSRAARLHRARTELRDGGASVSDTAFRHGFEHLGRFAGYYRAFYGENPSATLRARPR